MSILKLNDIAIKRIHACAYDTNHGISMDLQILNLQLREMGFKIVNQPHGFFTRLTFSALMQSLEEMRGGTVKYVPLFNNFPDERPDNYTYFLRRILGGWGFKWVFDSFDFSNYGANFVTQTQDANLYSAAVKLQEQRLADSHVEWIDLEVVSLDELAKRLEAWFSSNIYAPTPVQETLWDDLFTVKNIIFPNIDVNKIVVKETLARLTAEIWEKEGKLIVKTPTDILRLFAFMKEQDVSLATPVKLKGLKLSKTQRRDVLRVLELHPNLKEDLLRHKGLWISVLNSLHPGDYKAQFPSVVIAFDHLRNDRIQSYASRLINSTNPLEVAKERPSELIRRVRWLCQQQDIDKVSDAIAEFTPEQVNALPLPLLLTAFAANAVNVGENRLVINKAGKPYVGLSYQANTQLSTLQVLANCITQKLKDTKKWKQIWIDPELSNLVIPIQNRKLSDGLLNIARGSKVSLKDENAPVLRLFVYWHQTLQGTDLDLSVMYLNSEFAYSGHIGWNDYGTDSAVIHSGDVQDAPYGASEFVDIHVNKIQATKERRYLLPAIVRYTGESFQTLQSCHAGWMFRQDADANYQLFDGKTVANKVTITGEGKLWIPFLYDIKERQLIFADLILKGSRTIEANKHFSQLATAISLLSQVRPTYFDLASFYQAANNAALVEKQYADVTIGISSDCTVNVMKLAGDKVLTLG